MDKLVEALQKKLKTLREGLVGKDPEETRRPPKFSNFPNFSNHQRWSERNAD